jgi:hypothetical protein
MGCGIIPMCKRCGKKKSYAIKRYASREEAQKQGFCLCVYDDEALYEQK